jgi:TRAP-type C4-dicarboxylate transport system permease small subunit
MIRTDTSLLERLQGVISRIEIGLGIAMLVLITFGVALQVLQRYLGLTGVGWSGELAMMSLVVLSLLVAGYLAARDQHITLEFIDGVLPQRGIAIAWLISRVIVIAIAGFFAWAGLQFVASGVAGNLASVALPKAPFFAVAAVGFILVVVDLLLDLVIKRGRMPQAPTDQAVAATS